MPIDDFLREHLTWAPPWIIGVALTACALGLAVLLHNLLVRAVARGLRRRSEFTRSLVIRTRGPSRLALFMFAVAWSVQIAPISPGWTRFIQHGLLVAFIVLVGWMVQTALDIGSALYMRRYRTDVSDNLLARKHLTQIRILRRALKIMVFIVTAGVALMTVQGVRQVGVSILAAGGAAGIIVGLALQPVLSNLIAGVQLALTQPIRLDDAVLIEGEFGHVEEITGTYVVVRLWDLRRMVVPLKYFLDQPFQNWTKESSDLLGSVMLYVDYVVPIGKLRAKFEEIVRQSPLWDGKVANFQVTDARERTMEVRCLMSASDSGKLADLRAQVREKMITYLQSEMPEGLPRDRIEVFPQQEQLETRLQ